MEKSAPTSAPSAADALGAIGEERAEMLMQGVPPSERISAEAQRIKAVKHALRREGKTAEADALMHHELAVKTQALLNKELASPGPKPLAAALQAQHPQAHDRLIETCCDHTIDILNTRKKHVHGPHPSAALQELATDPFASATPEMVEAMKQAHALHVAQKRPWAKQASVPLPPGDTYGDTYGGGHVHSGGCCGTGIGGASGGHVHDTGAHYHGGALCEHAQDACPHAHMEPKAISAGKNKALIAAGVGALAVGAYLINEYGKEPVKERAR